MTNKSDRFEDQLKTSELKIMISPEAKRLVFATAKKLHINLSSYIRYQLYALIDREIPPEATPHRE